MKSNSLRSPFRMIATGLIAATLTLSSTVVGPNELAQAAGTPSGPQYSYQMINVFKSGNNVTGARISTPVCATLQATTASYTTSSTRTNTFSVTGDLGFSALKNLLSGKVTVSGGITESTTITEVLTVVVPVGKCMAVFELRDRYTYTLQRKCNYACTTKEWVTIGTGVYSKLDGRAYLYTN